MKDLIKLYREVEVTDAGASTKIPVENVTPPAKVDAAAAKVEAPAFAIPDAYKDKPYLKGTDSIDKVYAMLDGAQTLIGKRPAGIPAPDAKPEEWDAFYEAVGRPKTAAEYQFEGADKADPAFLPKVQAAMHKAGLTPAQAKTVYAEVNSALTETLTAKGTADAQANTDFDALANKTFGVNRDKILASSKALIEQFAPADMKGEIAKMSNENLIILAGVLNGVSNKYIKPDGAPGGQPTATGMTPADVSAKARTLMLDPAYSNPFHVNHAAIKKQVDDLYTSLRK